MWAYRPLSCPNKLRNPLRFGLRAASSALFRAMAGTLSAICLWRVFCRRYSAARSFSCDSLFASILRRLSIPFCSERNTLRKEHSVLSITIRCKWYSSLSLSVHSMTVSPRNESPATLHVEPVDALPQPVGCIILLFKQFQCMLFVMESICSQQHQQEYGYIACCNQYSV